MSNFTPDETMLIDDIDSPWINKWMKGLINEKHLLLYKKHPKIINSELFL